MEPGVRGARSTAGSRTSRSPAATHSSAGDPSATPAPSVMSTPPSGGPTNWFAPSSTANRRLFARVSWSVPTMPGRIVCDVVSASVSIVPSVKATT